MRTILLTLFLASAATAGPLQAPKVPQAPVRTSCDCAKMRQCLCFDKDCTCLACGRGGAAVKVPKGQSPSGTTQPTPVQTPIVNTPPQPVQGPGSNAATTGVVTYTLVPSVGQSGGTSCPNGQCQSPTTRRRR